MNDSLVIAGIIVTAAIFPISIRAALLTGMRGFFAAGVGALFGLVWIAVYAWQRDVPSVVFALHGFAAVGWALVIGGNAQMRLVHEKEYARFRREKLAFRSARRTPRLLPPFSLDLRWLLGGAAVAVTGLGLAILAPRQFLLAWAQTLLGAFMMVASTGGFSGDKREPPQAHTDAAEHG